MSPLLPCVKSGHQLAIERRAMASYKYVTYLSKSESDAFDKEFSPGDKVAWSGIYRCLGCGWEIAANEGNPFPPQNHHQHSVLQGRIRWNLNVYAAHKN